MASGLFGSCFKSAGATLEPTTLLSTLPDFDMTLLRNASLRLSLLPPGCIRLNGFDRPLFLEALYQRSDVETAVLEALCDRVYFSKLDVGRLRANLLERTRALNRNPEVLAISERLAALAADPQTAGGEQHRALLSDLHQARQRRGGAEDTRLRTALARLLSMLAAYTADSTSIALGSNRANRAKEFDDADLENIGDCVALSECPVMLCEGQPACILLQAPPMSFRTYTLVSSDSDSDDDIQKAPAVVSVASKKIDSGVKSMLEFCTFICFVVQQTNEAP